MLCRADYTVAAPWFLTGSCCVPYVCQVPLVRAVQSVGGSASVFAPSLENTRRAALRPPAAPSRRCTRTADPPLGASASAPSARRAPTFRRHRLGLRAAERPGGDKPALGHVGDAAGDPRRAAADQRGGRGRAPLRAPRGPRSLLALLQVAPVRRVQGARHRHGAAARRWRRRCRSTASPTCTRSSSSRT